MRRQKGFTLIELLIVLAIVGIIAVIVIPSLMRALQLSSRQMRISRFQTYFPIVLPVSDATIPLTEKQIAILRPLVVKRLHEICNLEEQSSVDPAVVQDQLNNLGKCAEAREAARKEGLLPAESFR